MRIFPLFCCLRSAFFLSFLMFSVQCSCSNAPLYVVCCSSDYMIYSSAVNLPLFHLRAHQFSFVSLTMFRCSFCLCSIVPVFMFFSYCQIYCMCYCVLPILVLLFLCPSYSFVPLMYCMCYCFSFKFRLFLPSLLYCSFVPPIYFLLFLLSIIRCSSYLCSIFLRSMFIFSSCLCAIVPLPNSFVPPIFVLLFLCPSYVSPIFLCTYVHMFYCSFFPLTNVPPFYVLLFLLSISRCSSYLGMLGVLVAVFRS